MIICLLMLSFLFVIFSISRKEVLYIDNIWLILLLLLSFFMIFKPELLWKIEHFFSVKGGEPTDLYLGLMRVAGVFLFLLSSIYLHYCFGFSKRRGAFNEKANT